MARDLGGQVVLPMADRGRQKLLVLGLDGIVYVDDFP